MRSAPGKEAELSAWPYRIIGVPLEAPEKRYSGGNLLEWVHMDVRDAGRRLAGKAIDVPKLRSVGPLVCDVVDPQRELPAPLEPAANIAVPLAIAGSANRAVRGQGIGTSR